MPHHKHHEKLERLKDAIKKSENLSEEEKSNALKHIEEWYIEDQADQYVWSKLKEKLLEISAKIEPILAELGFL
ncbi:MULTISPECIES: hypothetical protein [Nitratiruptor]|uniref:Uncharacterized protein n=1 Tax=Nitratiruptor tergarcus DSM 16512 TaxID=1069081 RepID=A0A1W1WR94_9BACT|nr:MULTISPECIES: hypothetical protein [Nitratiruptor]BCD61256.1 hypothetical protein NitYY0813_C0090 [Nitratiruptor sp. YY08-13]BCD65189.1 hypothetical protein NitYY0826_C0090 [Nitratiruptor sp. YY08-26]SMC08766.1 hypothetical protein SAMN05660197_0533 [Nitratiruptor tergarcus DSM 16512]